MMRNFLRPTRIRAVCSFFLAYFSIQMWHTIRDKNRWPFCSYNMFSYFMSDHQTQPRVRLITDNGLTRGPMVPWGLMPVEFFRVEKILRQVLVSNEDVEVRNAFC